MIKLPCPVCSETGFATVGDRHAETIQDICRRCAGTGQIRAETGEKREASADPQTGRPLPSASV